MSRWTFPTASAVTLAVVLLARPVEASSITINDTLANNIVGVTYSDTNFTNVQYTANCTPTAGSTTTAGSLNCTEPSFTITVDDNSTFGLGGNNIIEVNFYEADGVTLSDTLYLAATDTTCTGCTPTVRAVLTFASGPGLTPFTGGNGITLANLIEGSVSAVLGQNQTDPITLTVVTAVPEPASLLLLGTGAVLGGIRRLRRGR